MPDNCFLWGRREENGAVMDNKVISTRILYVFQRERERGRDTEQQRQREIKERERKWEREE